MSWFLEQGPASDVVLATRVRVARNLETYPFPRLQEGETAEACAAEIREAFYGASSGMRQEYHTVALADLPEIQVGELVEKRLISSDLAEKPEHAYALIREDESISILLGEEDHIRIQSMQPGLQIQLAYQEAEAVALLLEERLPLAFDARYGFLTTCPSNVGTGLRVSLLLHLPALRAAKQIEPCFAQLRQLRMTVRGSYGENTEPIGDLYQLSNQTTLGVQEGETLQELQRAAQWIIQLERHYRRQLWLEDKQHIEDSIFRSYGILRYARSISRAEAAERLSWLRWGLALGILPHLTASVLNRLAAQFGPATIAHSEGQALSPSERDAKRAALFREQLESCERGQEV